ncbi:MAG: hypothetical protein ABI591_21455, partial [Kofleriaceae bacterium]
RGELILLMLRAEDQPNARLAAQISAFQQRHVHELHVAFGGTLTWRRGFVDRLEIDRGQVNETIPEVLEPVLHHPSCALISAIGIRDWSTSEVLRTTLDLLARRAPRGLRRLELSVSSELPGLAQLDALPNLTSLTIASHGGGPGPMYNPIDLSWALGHQATRDIAHHGWPLTHLELDFGQGSAQFDDLRPLFRRTGTSLTHFNVATRSMTRSGFATELVGSLVTSPLAGQLEHLGLQIDLSRADYRTLIEHKHRFKRLRSANLPVQRNADKLIERSSYYR